MARVPLPFGGDLVTFQILVDGSAIPDRVMVYQLNIQKAINQIGKASVTLQEPGGFTKPFPVSNSDVFLPGKKIEIKVGYQSDNETLFKGVIVKLSLRDQDQDDSQLIVECWDEAAMLNIERKSKTFYESTDGDLLKSILQEYPLESDVQATPYTHAKMVQYHSTDWDFLLARAAANGLVVLVDDGEIIVQAPDFQTPPTLEASAGQNMTGFSLDMDASQQVSSAVARSWNAHQQTMEEAVANTTSAIENGNISGKKLAEVFGSQPLTLQHGGQADPPELQAWADAQLLWSRMASMNGEICLPGTAIPKPGQMMELSGLGDRFNGPTFISEVHHQIKSGTWETRIGIGLNTELLRPLQAPSQSTIAELVPAISGLQIGKVTQLEGDPTGHERIRVNIPLISQNGEGIWARLGSLDAGNNRGVVFRPEIGDEVIVGFINDDPRDAIVLGLLHSAAAPAPFPADDNNPQKGIVTRNGLRFIFNDEQKLVNLQTPAGHQVELNENTGTLTLRDQTGNQITLHSDGITLDSQKDLNLQAVGKVKVNGLIIELNASAELKAEGSASAELSSSGQTTIKGALININ